MITNATILELWVDGTPASQGSIIAIAHRTTGRPIAIQSSRAKLRSWREDIGTEATLAMHGRAPFDGPVRVALDFYLPQPRRSRFSYPTAPDLDKLIRAALDALTGIAYADDRQVISLTATKVWTERPGAYIRVENLHETA